MKRLKMFAIVMMAIMMLCGAADAYAQRKKTTARKTTTSRTSTPAPQKAVAIDPKNIEGGKLVLLDCLSQPKDTWTTMYAKFKSNGYGEINLGEGTEADITWSVSGNKLTIEIDRTMSIVLTSYDGGITFKGNLISNGVTKDLIYAANRYYHADKNMNPKVIQSMIEKGDYLCFVFYKLSRKDAWMGSSCKLKFTPDDDTSGTFKISSSAELISTLLGTLKGEYEWGENALYTSKFNVGDGQMDEIKYEWYGDNYFFLNLGKGRIPTIGLCDIYLEVIKKF